LITAHGYINIQNCHRPKKKENAPLNGCETKHECDVASRPAAAEDVDDALQAFQMASKVKLDSKR
jgi:hypothetical protein